MVLGQQATETDSWLIQHIQTKSCTACVQQEPEWHQRARQQELMIVSLGCHYQKTFPPTVSFLGHCISPRRSGVGLSLDQVCPPLGQDRAQHLVNILPKLLWGKAGSQRKIGVSLLKEGERNTRQAETTHNQYSTYRVMMIK